MKNLARILIVVVLLAGCAEYQMAKMFVKTEGAKLEDERLKVKIWNLCMTPRRGALIRYFSDKPEKAAALTTLCQVDKQIELIGE